jgi:hypothetical protein
MKVVQKFTQASMLRVSRKEKPSHDIGVTNMLLS